MSETTNQTAAEQPQEPEEDTRSELRRAIAEIDPKAIIYEPKEFDEAIIGYAENLKTGCSVVVYDSEKFTEILAREMTHEQAEEFFEYNTAGGYLGDHTPILVRPILPLED